MCFNTHLQSEVPLKALCLPSFFSAQTFQVVVKLQRIFYWHPGLDNQTLNIYKARFISTDKLRTKSLERKQRERLSSAKLFESSPRMVAECKTSWRLAKESSRESAQHALLLLRLPRLPKLNASCGIVRNFNFVSRTTGRSLRNFT